MSLRGTVLKCLYAFPRFRGRDRLIDLVAKGASARPERVGDRLLMDLDLSEWVQLQILVAGSGEPATLKLFERLLASGDVMFDVGAHVGHHALVAARAVGPQGRVYAFDPQPYNIDRICRNAELNGLGNIFTVCAACGGYDGFVRIPFQDPRDRARLSLAAKGPNDRMVETEVAIRRLDHFMTTNGVRSGKLLKIDVEGYELDVVRGLGDCLTTFDNIVFELLPDSDRDKALQLIETLVQAGFTLRDVEGNAWAPGKPLLENNVWAVRAAGRSGHADSRS